MVDEISNSCLGHGVEIYYLPASESEERILVAFVVGFEWLPERGDTTEVIAVTPESPQYFGRELDGYKVISEMMKLILPYICKGIIPKPGKLNKNFSIRTNC